MAISNGDLGIDVDFDSMNDPVRLHVTEVGMTARSRRSHWALVVCGALVAGQALFVSAPVSTMAGGSCAELRVWAQPYEGSTPTLDEMARFDRPHRKAIFNAIAPAARAALWQEQLQRFDRRADLSPAQHALIAEGRALITPALYEHEQASTAAHQAFWSRASQAFDSPDAKRAWLELGSVVASAPAPAQTSAWDTLTAPFRAQANTADCNCATSTGTLDCGGGKCTAGGCANWQGCGPNWTTMCNGTCS